MPSLQPSESVCVIGAPANASIYEAINRVLIGLELDCRFDQSARYDTVRNSTAVIAYLGGPETFLEGMKMQVARSAKVPMILICQRGERLSVQLPDWAYHPDHRPEDFHVGVVTIDGDQDDQGTNNRFEHDLWRSLWYLFCKLRLDRASEEDDWSEPVYTELVRTLDDLGGADVLADRWISRPLISVDEWKQRGKELIGSGTFQPRLSDWDL